jgi:hypothetical protein
MPFHNTRQIKFPAVTLIALVFAAFALADAQADRAQLMGTWQSDGNEGTKTSWTLQETGETIHMVNASDAQTVENFECNTDGKECSIKHGGHPSKVSIWFNGSKMVELETTGGQVVKRRFSITGNGESMELETIPVSAGGSTEVTKFKRVSSVNSNAASVASK